MKKNIINNTVLFFSLLIVIMGSLTMIYSFKEQVSIKSVILGIFGFLILIDSINGWEKRIKSLFGIKNEEV